MNASEAKAAGLSSGEEDLPLHFGEWLKRRRQELDLTQDQLAMRASCSVFTIRKVESGERHPSRQLAKMLAGALKIPEEEQGNFIKAARGELSVDRLASPVRAPMREPQPPVQTGPSTTNLPRPLTPFIGREPELGALGRLLQDPRCSLLTIVGAGGIGKTRLAIEAARHSQDIFPDGVWFVPLATLNSPALLVSAIADALRFKFQGPIHPQAQLQRYLCGKHALLILDNAEHLLEGVGLFAEILSACPGVKLLVTSRERVNLLSEWVFEIQGLPTPAGDEVESFESYSAVALFLQSARRALAGFELRGEDRRWVREICQAIEGMPLGIELSAAWVGLLSCEEIAREIERNLDFLTVSMRDLPERHRSLRGTLDHSWNLLNDKEQSILSRLSVFQGPFRREAAEEISGASLAVLSSLRNKMLLYRTNEEFYSLHELVRQYAGLKLREDAAEGELVKDGHASYYVRQLTELEKALKSSRQMETLDEMEMEIDNLRQAWQRMISQCGSDNHGAPFNLSLFRSAIFSLSLFFEMRCRYWEAVNLFSQSVETVRAVRNSLVGKEENQSIDACLGLLAAHLGYHQYLMHYEQANDSLDESICLLEKDAPGKARAQVILGLIYQAQGQYQKAGDLFQQSLVVFQQENDAWWCTLSLSNIAAICFVQGNIHESVRLYEESLNRSEPDDLRLRVQSQIGLGYAHFSLGDYSAAERLLQESLELSYRVGNLRQAGYGHRILGQVALAKGHREQAKEHFQKCVDVHTRYGESPDLALALIWLGKDLAALGEMEAARETFRRVIQIGRSLCVFHIVYWGLVNEARVTLVEGQPEKALETMFILQQYSVESKTIQNDAESLLAELREKFSTDHIEKIKERVQGLSIGSL